MRQPRYLGYLVAGILLCSGTAAWAQGPGRAQPARPRLTIEDNGRADDVRNELQMLLERHPPALGRVLKLDPSLLSDQGYLASYPDVAAYLGEHPEIARSPSYFLSFVRESNTPDVVPLGADQQVKMRALGMWQDTMTGLMVFLVFLTVTWTITWIIRFIVSHRRWLRVAKTQTDLHARLLERFANNDELLAYIQSPAGGAFLKGAPMAPDLTSPTVAAPFSRILWSVQAGIVLAAAGIGLLFVRHYLFEEVAEMLLMLGAVALALGTGFVLSALASYALSRRLGLIESAPPRGEANAGA